MMMMMMIEFLVMYNKMVAQRTEQADVLMYFTIHSTFYNTYMSIHIIIIQYNILFYTFSSLGVPTPKVFHSSSPKQNTYKI